MTPELACLATVWEEKATRVIRQESLCHLTITPIHLLCPPQHPQPWSKVQIGNGNVALWTRIIYETLSVFLAVSSAALSFITLPNPEANHRAYTADIHQHLLSAHNKLSGFAVDTAQCKHIHTSLWFTMQSRLFNCPTRYILKNKSAQLSLVWGMCPSEHIHIHSTITLIQNLQGFSYHFPFPMHSWHTNTYTRADRPYNFCAIRHSTSKAHARG